MCKASRVKSWSFTLLKCQPRTSGEDIHDNRQVHKSCSQADVGDITDPNLLGMGDLQFLDQVGIAWIGVIAVGGTAFPAFYRPQQLFLAHDALHTLAIDAITIRRPPELAAYPPCAIGDVLPGHFLHIGHQLAFISGRSW